MNFITAPKAFASLCHVLLLSTLAMRIAASDALESLKNPKDISFSLTAWQGKEADLADVEQWELEAAHRALYNLDNLTTGGKNSSQVAEWDLVTSRENLLERKESTYASIPDLITPQVEEADELFRNYSAASNGEWQGTEVTVQVRGMAYEKFVQGLGQIMPELGLPISDLSRRDIGEDLAKDLVWPMHPEHYAMYTSPIGVAETWGPKHLPTRTSVEIITDKSQYPSFVNQTLDTDYLIRYAGIGRIFDGPIATYVAQQITPAIGGLDIRLAVWYPQAAPIEYLEIHSQHYSIEFKNLILLIAGLIGN